MSEAADRSVRSLPILEAHELGVHNAYLRRKADEAVRRL